MVKNLPAMQETGVGSLCWEDPLDISSTLAWRIPWTEEPGGLQSMGSQRVRYDWATDTNEGESTHRFIFHSLQKFNLRSFCLAFASTSAVLILPFSISEADLQNIGKKPRRNQPSNFLNFGSHSCGGFSFPQGFYWAEASGDGDPWTWSCLWTGIFS